MSHDHHHGDGPRGPDHDRGGPGHDRGGGERRGPPESSFLHLEISRVMYAEAEQLAQEAGRELMKEAIKARLRERIGDRLEALARLAADELADDLLANLDIEARIDERRRTRQGLPGRLAEALHGAQEGDADRKK